MPSSPPGAVVTLAVATELQEQLLVQERELDSREGVVPVWEDALAAFEHALERVCMEHDAVCVQAEAAEQDFYARMCASSSRSEHSINLNRMLEERHNLLC
jgi:hypothetical protein